MAQNFWVQPSGWIRLHTYFNFRFSPILEFIRHQSLIGNNISTYTVSCKAHIEFEVSCVSQWFTKRMLPWGLEPETLDSASNAKVNYANERKSFEAGKVTKTHFETHGILHWPITAVYR